MLIEGLLIFIVILLVINIALHYIKKQAKVESSDIKNAVFQTWNEMGLSEKLGVIEENSRKIEESYRSFEDLLRTPTTRGAFGELSLEAIFNDQIPKKLYGLRERILDGKIPDANIKSPVGLICIDSKFPLVNFQNMIKADGEEEKERFKKLFINDVKSHLDKIAEDYVCPEKGSAEFAFAYLPSEAVFYFLVTEAVKILQDYTSRGVQVVSPLTLSHRVQLIKAGIEAKRLSEDAIKVKNKLITLTNKFQKIDELWRVFYTNHLKNLQGKADELEAAYNKLKEEFNKISNFSD